MQYSQSQLEHKVNELIERHDKERLVKAKNIDVYDIVDLIGCTPDWFYITPDLSVLGMTAFHDVSNVVMAAIITKKECIQNG